MHITVGLVGNPNCGKSTLFNALTGSNQKIGNWPGVTVERKTGSFIQQTCTVNVVDLPGTYSLINSADNISLDEKIACQYILSRQADIIVNVVNAANLERNLYLTAQLLEMGVPVIIALNMMDVARQQKLEININKLSELIGCPVIPLESHRRVGIDELKKNLLRVNYQSQHGLLSYPPVIDDAIAKLTQKLNDEHPNLMPAHYYALRLLEGDSSSLSAVNEQVTHLLVQHSARIQEQLAEEVDILIADLRYSAIHEITQQVVQSRGTATSSTTSKLDKIVLNRFLGIPIFFGVMYLMFLFAINVGGAFQDFFDITTNTIFVQGFTELLQAWHAPTWLIAILASGFGKGVNTTLTFIPVISAMFLFLSMLEASGYMARAAFVMDRGMRALGLPGKSFVPMIVGFGCNVPAIMAARTLDTERDRILTTLISPFMSCSARLAIFAVFVAAFFPAGGGQNIVFILYFIGILTAVLTGLILRKTLLSGKPSPFIMELPPYHLPTLQALFQQTWSRLQHFLFRAGKVLIPVCILLGILNSISLHGAVSNIDGSTDSLLSGFGRLLTPIFSPMGIANDNWPATVGLITGTLAKEVVIATLNTLYAQVGHVMQSSTSNFDLWLNLKTAILTIPENLKNLPQAFSNPIMASAPVSEMSSGVYGVMYQRFNGINSAFAYLLFVLLYIPCASTMAVISKELNKGWMWFANGWSLWVAYSMAVAYYQVSTVSYHPLATSCWLVGIGLAYVLLFLVLRGQQINPLVVSLK